MVLRLVKTDKGTDGIPPTPENPIRTRWDEIAFEWWKFHKKNPKVYRMLCSLAEIAWGNGVRRLGMSLLFEVIRWNLNIVAMEPGKFKMNNNYKRLYVDLYEANHPHRAGLFRKRKCPSKNRPPTDKEALGPKDYPEEE